MIKDPSIEEFAALQEALDAAFQRGETLAGENHELASKRLSLEGENRILRAELICPHDGAALKEIGVEASEQLDIIAQQVRVIRHERVKYACPCCDGALRLPPVPI